MNPAANAAAAVASDMGHLAARVAPRGHTPVLNRRAPLAQLPQQALQLGRSSTAAAASVGA